MNTKRVIIGAKAVDIDGSVNWIAQDASGVWYGYKTQPAAFLSCFLQPSLDSAPIKILEARPNPDNWKPTLRMI